MAVKASSYERLIGLENELKEVSDTSLRFFDLGDLHRRLNSILIHPITQKLKESGLVQAVGFLMVVQALELVRECIEKYNPQTKQILFPDQSVLLYIN